MTDSKQESEEVRTEAISQAENVVERENQHLLRKAHPKKCYSASGNNYFLSKKQLQANSGHPYQASNPSNTRLDLNIASRNNLSSFTQRVMSAKLLRLKQLQNQLSEAHLQLNELSTENRLLRALQKRQDAALDRYEGTQAQLPQLVRSHQEEVRVLRTKYKNLKHQCRHVANTLKEREAELQNLKEQHAHLQKLAKDRSLGEREALSKQISELKSTVDNQANTIQVLNRKVLLETKNLKFQLHQEMQRHKTTQSELQQMYLKIDQLQIQLDHEKEKNALPFPMDRPGKGSSSHKLLNVKKSARVDGILAQNFKVQKTCVAEAAQLSTIKTEPSSAIPEFSHGPSSEKKNDLSASLDSSAKHAIDIVESKTNDVSAKSDTQHIRRLLLPTNPNKDKNTFDKCSLVENHNSDLEKEYENAVAMLAELSTKNDSNAGDISSSLASLDLMSAKHVAALANATFALKEKDESVSESVPKPDDQLSPVKSNLKQVGEVSPICKIQLVSAIEERHSANSRSGDSGSLSDSTSHLVGINLQTSRLFNEFPDTSMNKNEKQQTFDRGEMPDKSGKSNEEEMEKSRKEALLRALKAIDDSVHQDNDSDDSDHSVGKMSPRTVIPTRMFSSLNSSGIGVGNMFGPVNRRKPFK